LSVVLLTLPCPVTNTGNLFFYTTEELCVQQPEFNAESERSRFGGIRTL